MGIYSMKKLFIQDQYRESFAPLFQDIDAIFEREGEVIYQQRNTIKVLEWGGALINIKRFAQPNFINRYVYRFLRTPKCIRATKYALQLRQLDINTPEPIGYLLHYDRVSVRESYLVTFQSPLTRTFYEFDTGGVVGRERIIRALAYFAADMHAKGVMHLDFSPGNILFDETPEGKVSFTLVDINRMKFGTFSLRECCRSFQRLWGGKDFLRVLANAYAEARSANPTEVYQMILHYHSRFWKGRNSWY